MSATNAITAMDVDSPSGVLKRCSSAPIINEGAMGGSSTASPSPTHPSATASHCLARDHYANVFGNGGGSGQPRMRRFSTSCSPGSGSRSPVSSGLRLTPRISQLRQEEWADTSNFRELAHEREVHHTMQISQSWEDLRLVTGSGGGGESPKTGPLHLNLSTAGGHVGGACASSPSPTRAHLAGFQSPTRVSRTLVRRSASPVLRPSPLGVKRKLDPEEYQPHNRAKRRFYTNGLLTTTASLDNAGGTPTEEGPNFSFPIAAESMILTKSDTEMAQSPS